MVRSSARTSRISPSSIVGYDQEEFTHQAVAAVIASGAADAGMGVRAVAERFGRFRAHRTRSLPSCRAGRIPASWINSPRRLHSDGKCHQGATTFVITRFADTLRHASFRPTFGRPCTG